MEKLKDLQMFTNNEKIGMLPPDTWVVYSSYEYNGDTIYRIAIEGQDMFRPIAVINGDIVHTAIENGIVTLLGLKKMGRNKSKENKK